METTNLHTRNQLDLEKIRAEVPILSRTVNGKPLIYFDNGGTAQKPKAVTDALVKYYDHQNSNIHRGVHTLSREVTIAYEQARETIQKHLNAQSVYEIVFTRGTTEGINLVAHCFGKLYVQAGDEIIVSHMEHHSNILPWQMLCEEKGAVLKVIPINEAGELILSSLETLITPKTKLIAVTHVSNTLGTVNPVKEIARLAHQHNVAVLVDGAQAIPHMEVDVQDLDCDFYTFSGHKAFGPTGVGILYGKEKWLNAFPPYQTGGGTIKTVTFVKTEYVESPLKFEAGTPHIEGGIGLAVALNYIKELGLKAIAEHEHELLTYTTLRLKEIEGLTIYGEAKEKVGVISFNVKGAHPFDVGTLLDKYGVAVRTGHHCTQPLWEFYGVPGTVRVSFAFYNTLAEVDHFIEYLKKAIKMLS